MVHAFCGECGKECWSPYLCCGHDKLPLSNFCWCNGDPVKHHEKHFGKIPKELKKEIGLE